MKLTEHPFFGMQQDEQCTVTEVMGELSQRPLLRCLTPTSYFGCNVATKKRAGYAIIAAMATKQNLP